MELIDFIALYRRAYFKIVDGPFEGKFCQINYIIYGFDMVITKTGTELSAKVVRPMLIPLEDAEKVAGNSIITFEEAIKHNIDFFDLIEKKWAVEKK